MIGKNRPFISACFEDVFLHYIALYFIIFITDFYLDPFNCSVSCFLNCSVSCNSFYPTLKTHLFTKRSDQHIYHLQKELLLYFNMIRHYNSLYFKTLCSIRYFLGMKKPVYTSFVICSLFLCHLSPTGWLWLSSSSFQVFSSFFFFLSLLRCASLFPLRFHPSDMAQPPAV